jgi:hypothetical protein
MAFKQVNKQEKIKGFYKDEEKNVLQGFARKRIWQDEKKGKGYFLIELTQSCKLVSEDGGGKIVEVEGNPGDFVGISRSAVLQDVDKYVDEGGPEIQIVFKGRTPSKKHRGKDVKLYDVFVDE